MPKIVKIILITIFGIAILLFACNVMFGTMLFRQSTVNEKFIESFDKQYMYTQLNSPKKTICTVVILENKESRKSVSYTLPYFNDRTIRKIAWGLNTNDLFVDSADTGLTVYRMIDGIWTPLYLIIEDNPDGTYAYSLHRGGNKEQRELRYELSSNTIPRDIETRIFETRWKFGDKVFKAPDE